MCYHDFVNKTFPHFKMKLKSITEAHNKLTKQALNVTCEDIHGDRSQSQRESALKKFRTGECDVLVATDVAARGLDVDGIQARVISLPFVLLCCSK